MLVLRSAGCRSAWTAGLLTVVLLSGCSSGAGAKQLLTPAQDALSAASSAVLALDLLEAGRSTTAVTQVALEDAVNQLASDEQTVLDLTVSSPDQEPTKTAVLEAIHGAVTAGDEAADAVATSRPTSTERAALEDATAGLTSLTEALQVAG